MEDKTSLPAGDPHKEKLRRIYTASTPLFERYGFRKTTVEDICSAAGMSKRTFYELFQDKSDLFIRMILDLSERMIAEWEKELPPEQDAASRIGSYVDFYVEALLHQPLFQLFREDPSLFTAFGQLGKELQVSPIVNLIRRIVGQGIEEGQFHVSDPDIAVWIMLTLLDTMFLYVPGTVVSMEELHESPAFVEEIKHFLLHGLGVCDESL